MGRERKATNRPLRSARRRDRALLDLLSDAVFLHDLSGKFLDVNVAACERLGYSREEFLHLTVSDIAFGEHAGNVPGRIEEIFRRNEMIYETAHVTRDGREIPTEVSSRIIEYDGSPAVLKVARDITDCKQAAEALRQARQDWEDIFEAVGQPIMILDPNRRVLAANRAVLETTGKRREEVLGRRCYEVFHGGKQPSEGCPLDRMLASGQMEVSEIEVETLHGTFLVSCTPLYDSAGSLQKVIHVATDMTQQKHAEALLCEQRDFANSLIETAESVIVVLDPAGRVVRINRFAEELTGYKEEELQGMDWFGKLLQGVDRDRVVEIFRRILDGEVMRGLENAIRRKDGRDVLLRWYNSALRDADGRVIGTLGIGHDITEIRRTEEQLLQAQKMEAVGRLAGGIAHDFNNQLTVIRGYCELLAGKAESATAGALAEIMKAADQAQRLTAQLLAYGRKQVLNPRVLDLGKVLGEMQNPLARMIGEDVQLAIISDPTLGRVRVDRSQVQQVVMNLAVNARDAMPDGGKLTIETANVDLSEDYARQHLDATAGPHVMLAVRDTGTGMNDETRSRIFDPFFTTKEVGRGTGLGLSMVYGFVRQSGGSIEVGSEEGVGTTMTIYLPRVAVAEPEPSGSPTSRPAPGGTQTILVVEDDAGVREFIGQALRGLGYTVLEADSAPVARSIARTHDGEIHLLVTDVIMPEATGPVLAGELVTVRPDLAVVYVSGYARDAFIRHGIEGDGVHLLSKPFTVEDLARMVHEVLGERP